MEVDPPHQLGLGCVWGTLDKIRRFIVVVAIVVRCCLRVTEIWGRLNVLCAPLAGALERCSCGHLETGYARIGLGEACSL